MSLQLKVAGFFSGLSLIAMTTKNGVLCTE